MTQILGELRSYLLADSTLLGLLSHSQAIYAGSVSKSAAAADTYIMLEQTGGEKVRSMDGFTGTRNSLVTIRVTSPNRIGPIIAIFRELDRLLEVNHTTFGTTLWVEHSFLDEPQDTSTGDTDGDADLLMEMSATLEMLCRFTA